MLKRLFLLLPLFLLVACTTLPTPDMRREYAIDLAAKKGWQAEILPAGPFDLAAFFPVSCQSHDPLTVYIEGDGFAWLDRSTPSSDPTPVDPLGLRLALLHPGGNAAYLARPCQYVGAEQMECVSRYWMEARFAPEVITATNQAVDALKSHFGAHHLQLVGYSGGGAIAELVAVRRDDVVRIITVAGNLDPHAWAAHHHLSPLTGSLDPVDYIDSLKQIPQWHFVGKEDEIVPPELAEAFSKRFPPLQQPVVKIVPSYDHHCCWVENWARLIGNLP